MLLRLLPLRPATMRQGMGTTRRMLLRQMGKGTLASLLLLLLMLLLPPGHCHVSTVIASVRWMCTNVVN